MSRLSPLLVAALLSLLSQASFAQSGTALLEGYRSLAAKEEPGFRDFSAQRGEKFFHAKTGDMSCAACHSDNPKAAGKHVKTGKAIEALAPVANPQRLSDPAKVEKWFKRNCNDVLQRACTAREKGDFVAWLVSVK